MSKASLKYKKRRKALEAIKNIAENSSEYLIIHYSCESFFNLPEGNTPRITSIAVRSVKNGQTHSFSIHKIAELEDILPNQIKKNYNNLEKMMLDEYFEFVRKHQEDYWIHINMRNINYGFEAINHRYRVLKGKPILINDKQKIDLAKLLIDIYGRNHSKHPRFESLYRKNTITMTSFLKGEEEAIAFNNSDYVALHQSTLRKVDNMQSVLSLVISGDLKTNSNIFQIYGITPAGIFFAAKDNWIVAVLLFIVATVATTIIGIGVTRFFNL